jgi:hypothetical protein
MMKRWQLGSAIAAGAMRRAIKAKLWMAVGFLGLTILKAAGDPAKATQNWTHFVRIGGYGLSPDRVDDIIQSATETHVFGIETDNDIPGRYESFLDPTEKLKAIRAVAEKAHAVGNKAFVYIAGLECITANADKQNHTFFKDHPDWVQRKVTGEPAVFGGGSAFWIKQGDEDVWISPYAPEWRKIYMERVRQIAFTGIDGVYVDIPYWMTHFKGWGDSWASFDDYTVAALKEKTGLNARKDIRLGDFSDPGFIQWVDFRIATLTDFMKEIDSNVKAANPNCMTIAEIYPGIEMEAVRVGADVYQMDQVVDVIAHEYEYGGGNPTAASRTPLDWFHYMTGMYSFRSFAGEKASWMLNYSWDGEKNVEPKEAMKNLFVAQLMAGTNTWDAKGHVMSGSNDMETRKAVFQWISSHEKTFYSPRTPIHPIGIYFSPQTRNYFPADFIEAYRGMMSLLLQAHLEFQIVTPRNLQTFSGDVLILPEVKCLSDAELNFLRSSLRSGKGLIVTGETGKYNDRREVRAENPIHRLLDIKDSAREGSSTTPQSRFIYQPHCPGRAYLKQLAEEFNDLAVEGNYQTARFNNLKEQFSVELASVLKFTPEVQVVASPFVSAQIARVNGRAHVFLANFTGLKSKESAVQTPERNVRISFPAKPDSRVYMLPFLGKVEEVRGEWKNGRMTCVIPEVHKGVVVWRE